MASRVVDSVILTDFQHFTYFVLEKQDSLRIVLEHHHLLSYNTKNGVYSSVSGYFLADDLNSVTESVKSMEEQ